VLRGGEKWCLAAVQLPGPCFPFAVYEESRHSTMVLFRAAMRTSHEVEFAAGYCVPEWPTDHRVPAVRRRHRFWRLRRVSSPAVPRLSRVGFIPSCVLSSPECLRLPSRAAFQFGATCLGVSSLFATLPKVSTLRGTSHFPLCSVLRFSQPPDGLLHLRLRGLVSSRSHVQGFRSGSWSQPAAVPIRHRPCLLALVASILTGCPAATCSQVDFEALFHGARRSSESVFSLLQRRYPLRFSSSRSFRSHRARTPLQRIGSAHGLVNETFSSALPLRGSPCRWPSAYQRYVRW